jgi:hypothetical protein
VRRQKVSIGGFKGILLATSIVFAVVSSIVIITLPVSAGGVTSTPEDTTITVVSGQTFLLRNELYFNQPAYGGYFAIAIYWDTPSSIENFVLENAPSVYWTSGPENGLPVENVQWENVPTGVPIGTAWQVGLWIDSADKNYIDGHFNVDVWLRAASGDGTLHQVGLENNIAYGVGISVIEQYPIITPVDNVAVDVVAPPAPSPAPVGGIAFSPDKLALLAPYIILAALIAIASMSVAVYWRRHGGKK